MTDIKTLKMRVSGIDAELALFKKESEIKWDKITKQLKEMGDFSHYGELFASRIDVKKPTWFESIRLDLINLSYGDVVMLLDGLKSLITHDITKAITSNYSWLDNRDPLQRLQAVVSLHTQLDVARKSSYRDYTGDKS